MASITQISREQIVEKALPVAVGDSTEGRAYPSPRTRAFQLPGFDQRGDDGRAFGTSILTGKKRVLPFQDDGTDAPFNAIVVELDASIGQEQREPSPIFGDGTQGFPSGKFVETRPRW